ncbi:MAG: response regulator [Myxococcota bacterium]
MGKGRVLAVDDQRYFRELLEGLLTEEGYDVQTASSAQEALDCLAADRFDVVVTDLVMPGVSGRDLVAQIKAQDPEQPIVVVTGVIDVKSAVDAMKGGATDYLLKPFDRDTLAACLEAILQKSQLQQERDRLLAENIEYMGERSLYERALALFSCLSLDTLAQRTLAALCDETGAQGGVLWAAEEGSGDFRMVAAQGLVRVDEERPVLADRELPSALSDPSVQSVRVDWHDPRGLPRPALVVAMRRAGALRAVIRLTDKLGGESFDEIDGACAERLIQLCSVAFANAERFARLERRTLQDPETRAYHLEYLQDVVRNEIEKANRFGRSFGLMKVAVEPVDGLRERLDANAFRHWHGTLIRYLGRLLRATDILATESDGQFLVMLAESDAIGAATFKQRTRVALEQGEPLAGVQADVRPEVYLGCVSYPGDASQLESLQRVLDARVDEERQGRSRESDLAIQPLAEALETLLASGKTEALGSAESLLSFAISETGRRPRERNLFFCHAGDTFTEALGEGLQLRRDCQSGTELVVLGNGPKTGVSDEGIVWVPSDRLPDCPAFAVLFGDSGSYVWVAAPEAEGDGVRLFHSSDRALAEELAFRMQRELDTPQLV